VKVLAVSSYAGLGGAELAMNSFIAHRPPGVHVGVVLVDHGPLAVRLSEQGLEVTALRHPGRPEFRDVIGFARELGDVLDRWRPDVVWACGQKGALLSVWPCRRRGVPLVWHKVDFSWDRLLGRPLATAVDGLISVSHAVVEPLGRWGARRHLAAVGVPVTLDPRVRAVPDHESPLLGTLTRLVPYKGVDRMIKAVAILRGEFPGVRLLVAGGPAAEYPRYPDELAALIRELGVEDAVELRGFVADVAQLLSGMSVFVNATYRDAEGFGLEGMPGSILEASFAGVPVVAPGTGGNVEAVLHGETGTLVSAPEPELLAAAIAPYLRDSGLWQRTSDAGRAWARRTSAPDVASARLFSALARVVN
jgi:glycosyltransferase involved in cell wall biosynthesis